MENERVKNAFEVEVPEGKGMLCVLDSTGDTKLIWDRNSEDEIDAAEATFDKLTKKGYAAFSVTKKGDKDVQIKKFDKKAEKIILVPPIAGG